MSDFRIQYVLDEENLVVHAILKQRNGDDEFEEVERETFDFESMENAGHTKLVGLYGLSKLLQDRASGVAAGPEKLEAEKDEFERLKSGPFRKEREGSGGAGGGIPVVVEAIAARKDISVAAAAKAYKNLSKEDKERVKENLAADIEKIREERKASSSVDLTDFTG